MHWHSHVLGSLDLLLPSQLQCNTTHVYTLSGLFILFAPHPTPTTLRQHWETLYIIIISSSSSCPIIFPRIDNRSKKVVAMKIIDLEEAEDEIEDIQQEITVLSQCDSPHVTRYFGSYLKVCLPCSCIPRPLGLVLHGRVEAGWMNNDFLRHSTRPPGPLWLRLHDDTDPWGTVVDIIRYAPIRLRTCLFKPSTCSVSNGIWVRQQVHEI